MVTSSDFFSAFVSPFSLGGGLLSSAFFSGAFSSVFFSGESGFFSAFVDSSVLVSAVFVSAFASGAGGSTTICAFLSNFLALCNTCCGFVFPDTVTLRVGISACTSTTPTKQNKWMLSTKWRTPKNKFFFFFITT